MPVTTPSSRLRSFALVAGLGLGSSTVAQGCSPPASDDASPAEAAPTPAEPAPTPAEPEPAAAEASPGAHGLVHVFREPERRFGACVAVVPRDAWPEAIEAARRYAAAGRDGVMASVLTPCLGTVEELAGRAPTIVDDLPATRVAQAIVHLRDDDDATLVVEVPKPEAITLPSPFDLPSWSRDTPQLHPDATALLAPHYDAARTSLIFDVIEDRWRGAGTHASAVRVTVDLRAKGWARREAPLPVVDAAREQREEVDGVLGGPVSGLIRIERGPGAWFVARGAGEATPFAWRQPDGTVTAFASMRALGEAHPEVVSADGLLALAEALDAHLVEEGMDLIENPIAWVAAYEAAEPKSVIDRRYVRGKSYEDRLTFSNARLDAIAPPSLKGDVLTMYLVAPRNGQPYRCVVDLAAIEREGAPAVTLLAEVERHADPTDPTAE